jgi:AP-1-like factor
MDYTTPSLWDFSRSPSGFNQLADNDFLALLQKQLNNPDPSPNPYPISHDGVDPSKITNLPTPAPPPPLSDDSSPSPPSTTDHASSSRRQSTNSTAEPDTHELKRKASIDAMEEESPSQKSSKKSPARRKSGTSHDESRLMKRKEQNRAAQRAFRERKEKHVKDLEDQVAELETKNMNAETENLHLKELLKRLQDENVSLRTTSFTFSVPRNGEPSDTPFTGPLPSFDSPSSSVFASTSHLPSPSSSAPTKAVATPQSSSLDTPSAFPADIDFGTLTSIDSSMNLLDDSDAIMSYDFGYGQFVPSKTPYKTIASNPMFMSFADPALDTTPTSKSSAQSPGSSPYDLTFGQWTGQTSSQEGNSHAGSIDELFGGHIFGAQSPLNFNVLLKSPATSSITSPGSALSPVIHQSIHTLSSGTSSVFESSEGSSPVACSSPSATDMCPKTRAQMEQRIQAEGSSIFAPPPPQEKEQVFKAPAGADGPMIMCKDATFPKTEKSDKNIEVLTAWRSITSHPHFKASNIDINDLCSEFTDKARCDGTKVVLDPQGVTSILEKFTARLTQGP